MIWYNNTFPEHCTCGSIVYDDWTNLNWYICVGRLVTCLYWYIYLITGQGIIAYLSVLTNNVEPYDTAPHPNFYLPLKGMVNDIIFYQKFSRPSCSV